MLGILERLPVKRLYYFTKYLCKNSNENTKLKLKSQIENDENSNEKLLNLY